MSIKMVVVVVECDGCATEFHVELDNTEKHSPDWTVFEVAEVAISSGDYVVGEERWSSIMCGKHLCPSCTQAVVKKYGEESVTTDQILEALDNSGYIAHYRVITSESPA
jgi:hypothetical protein